MTELLTIIGPVAFLLLISWACFDVGGEVQCGKDKN